MKQCVVTIALAAACGGAPVVDEPVLDSASPAAAPELALLESLPAIDGTALPPRADSPRTLVMFFASW